MGLFTKSKRDKELSKKRQQAVKRFKEWNSAQQFSVHKPLKDWDVDTLRPSEMNLPHEVAITGEHPGNVQQMLIHLKQDSTRMTKKELKKSGEYSIQLPSISSPYSNRFSFISQQVYNNIVNTLNSVVMAQYLDKDSNFLDPQYYKDVGQEPELIGEVKRIGNRWEKRGNKMVGFSTAAMVLGILGFIALAISLALGTGHMLFMLLMLGMIPVMAICIPFMTIGNNYQVAGSRHAVNYVRRKIGYIPSQKLVGPLIEAITDLNTSLGSVGVTVRLYTPSKVISKVGIDGSWFDVAIAISAPYQTIEPPAGLIPPPNTGPMAPAVHEIIF